jgi:hypothetical protein
MRSFFFPFSSCHPNHNHGNEAKGVNYSVGQFVLHFVTPVVPNIVRSVGLSEVLCFLFLSLYCITLLHTSQGLYSTHRAKKKGAVGLPKLVIYLNPAVSYGFERLILVGAYVFFGI